ncbi:MAG: SRPBCC domain-containing protein [Actinomycetota bacterium]
MNEVPVTIDPLRKRVVVPLPPEDAFVLFTEGMASWWPLVTHSVAGERAISCRFEPLAGGRIYEIDDEGREVEWGRILLFEPPGRLIFSWYPGRGAETAQEVEVVFERVEGGTAVALEHRGWESLREDALEVRGNYEAGWDLVLGRFLESAATQR